MILATSMTPLEKKSKGKGKYDCNYCHNIHIHQIYVTSDVINVASFLQLNCIKFLQASWVEVQLH